jgi:hypothetical protein
MTLFYFRDEGMQIAMDGFKFAISFNTFMNSPFLNLIAINATMPLAVSPKIDK